MTRSVEYIFFSWCCRFMYAFDVNDTKFLVDIQCWFGQHGQGHQPQSNCFGSFKTLYQKLRAFLCSKQNNIVRCIEISSIFFSIESTAYREVTYTLLSPILSQNVIDILYSKWNSERWDDDDIKRFLIRVATYDEEKLATGGKKKQRKMENS